MSTPRRSFGAWAVGAFTALLMLLVPSGIVSAHAIVDDVTPADGSALADAPAEVVFTFSEPILADGVAVEISTSGESAVPTTSAAVDPADPTRVIVSLGAMPTGTYQVRLRVRDLEDLHEVVARTSFAVGESAPPPSAPIVDGAEPLETGARWMFAIGVALLTGVAALRARRRPVELARPARLRRLVVAGVALVIAGRIGVLVARALSLDGGFTDGALTVLRTQDTQRLVLVGIALACVVVSEMPSRAVKLDVPVRVGGHVTIRQALGWTGVVNLAVLAAWGGHSALNGPIEPLTLVVKAAHLTGIGLWVGVLAVLVVVNGGTRLLRPTMAEMSGVAVGGAFVTVVSGVLLTSRLVVSVTAVASTPYGRMLTFKVGLVVVIALVGYLLRASAGRRWPVVELLALVVIVLLGAAVATATPAVDPGFTARDPGTVPVAPATAAADLLVQARAIPARPGANTIEFRVAETRRPSPGPVTGIEATIDGTRYVTRPNADGVAYVEGVVLPAGDSSISVAIVRQGTDDSNVDLTVAVRPAVYVHQPVLTSARIRGPLIALSTLIGAVGVGLWLRRRHGRGGDDAASSSTRDRVPADASTAEDEREASRTPGNDPGSDTIRRQIVKIR